MSTTPPLELENMPGNYPEDRPIGMYLHTCTQCNATFSGHKARCRCKRCDLADTTSPRWNDEAKAFLWPDGRRMGDKDVRTPHLLAVHRQVLAGVLFMTHAGGGEEAVEAWADTMMLGILPVDQGGDAEKAATYNRWMAVAEKACQMLLRLDQLPASSNA